jgi:hypothetical protein
MREIHGFASPPRSGFAFVTGARMRLPFISFVGRRPPALEGLVEVIAWTR